MVMTVREYDLNIFQQEYEVPDTRLADPSQGTMWEYRKPWYLHVYWYDGGSSTEVSEPIELTEEESAQLIDNDPYFDNEVDVWYGFTGFVLDKQDKLSPRLKAMFETLPAI
jgi:hypothetical protein